MKDERAHPTLEQLSRYHGGELDEDAATALRAHLVHCRACTASLLEVASFSTPDPPTPAAAWEAPKQAAWRQLETRLTPAAGMRRRLAAVLHSWSALWSGAEARPVLRAVASATVLIVAVGLGFGLGWRARDSTSSSRPDAVPQLYVPGINLFPRGFDRSASENARLRLPAGIDLFTVTLNLLDEPTHDVYRLRILDASGREVWAGTGLQKTAIGNFSIALFRTLLPPGVYQLEVVGIDPGGHEEEVGTFALEIEHAP